MSDRLASYWKGKVLLMTGGSSGLGAAVIQALAPYKINFGLLGRREEQMQNLAASLGNSGSTFWIRSCDVRDREQINTAVQDFYRYAGRLDVAWVNSGVSRGSSFRDWNWQAVDDMINTNLTGAINTTIACLQVMVPQGFGAIVGIGSAASMRGLGGHGIYSLTKIGLAYFLEAMAIELPEIQFTIIHPGFVDTPINRGNSGRLWLMAPERAARIMIKAVARQKLVVIYPWQMKMLYRVVQTLPEGLYQKFARRLLMRNMNKP